MLRTSSLFVRTETRHFNAILRAGRRRSICKVSFNIDQETVNLHSRLGIEVWAAQATVDLLDCEITQCAWWMRNESAGKK